ncbi:MAG: hypothetical protein ACREU1_01865, partial [Burkholderiales bacterium]
EQAQADAKAVAALQRRLAAEQRSEAEANRRAEAESAAADALRAGIAAEEGLELQTAKTAGAVQRAAALKEERAALARLRPARRGIWIVAGAAVLAAAGYLLLVPRETPLPERPAGEPLKLKLEFAFPAAQR